MEGPRGHGEEFEGAFWGFDEFLHDGRVAEFEEAKAEEEAQKDH